MKRHYRILISVVIGVALAALIAFAQTAQMPAPSVGVAGTPIGDNFEGLVDQNNNPITADRFAGKYQLVFFGFTHCPAVCPIELQRLGYVLKKLDEKSREKLAPIFVSVDPERDTPKALKEYLSLFDPAITGITGEPVAIKQTLSNWKVYAAKMQMPEMTEYTMDHSTYLYLRDPQGRLLALYKHEDEPEAVLAGVKAHLAQ